MLQLHNTTHNHINKTDINPISPSVFAHNFNEFKVSSKDINSITPPQAAGYAPIVRQPTQNITLNCVPIERGRQKIVKENYPLIIPAIGKRCEDSQTVLGAYRCNDCHRVELKVAHCEEWTCRVCGSRKVRRQSKDMVRRLYAFKRALGTSANPRHFVLSSLKWADMNISQITKSMNHIWDRYLPDISGVYVIHPFRIRGWDNISAAGSKARFYSDANIKRRLREYRGDKSVEVATLGEKPIEEKLGSNGFWDMIKDDVLGLGSWRKYCYVSPHVHVIGWGKLPNADEFYQMTKGSIIYKMIDTNGIGRSFEFNQKSGSFDFSSEVLRTMNYLGSHAAIRSDDSLIDVKGQKKRKHANRIFRPFGLCSTKSFVLDSFNGKKYVLDGDSIIMDIVCPECGRQNLEETFRYNKSHYYEADEDRPFDDDYNPLDSEGNVITELIAPLRFWEWNWYRYKFNHVYAGDVERFAAKLPKPKLYVKCEYRTDKPLLHKVLDTLEASDMIALKNTNNGILIV